MDGTGSATLDTGPLTSNKTYTLVSVDWATAPSCSKTATGSATITVVPLPTVDAGSPQTICADDLIILNGSIGGGAASVTWATGGDGSFDDDTDLNATYTPGPNDLANGTVTLTLTTDPVATCGRFLTLL